MDKNILTERILAELARAKDSLAASKLLLKNGLFADSISRSYYAIFHAAKAVLLTKEIDPSSHNGAITMFGLHFVKPGLIEEVYGRIYNETKDVRELGDYIVTKKFTREETEKRTNQAIQFLERMFLYLKEFTV
ncbi:MAG: HEPN domain-containing protein [bacterium]